MFILLRMETFLVKTLRLARESGMSGSEIANGADVGYRWYCKLVSGEIKDPGINRVQKLHDYLSAVAVKAAA